MFAKKNDIESLKLIDFGLSMKHSNKESTIFTGKCGTALYMAPEVFTNYQYSKYVDLWSVGIIAYIVLVGRHPLHRSGEDVAEYVSRLRKATWKFPKLLSDLAKSFILKLVKVNPLERYTAKEALEHPWITRAVGKIPLSYAESVAHGRLKERFLNVNKNNIGRLLLAASLWARLEKKWKKDMKSEW
eukprot:TRINITY_DN877_c0_g2_i18.p1 TRINITY_DN877_c0_g2~~TRINITY_DN877_c0_g2_i18.p1  ORF type:complete len:187 (-),score=40.90 TRINITY_DN877_c0_g2_i18:871-1431(-)